MNTKLFLFILIFVFGSACSQSNTDRGNWLKGEWRLSLMQETSSGQQMIDCTDVLVFQDSSQYRIYDDCYADGNNRESLVEYGQWTFDSKENKILLKNRKFLMDYTFHNSSSVLTLFVKEHTDTLLRICFNLEKCIPETYEKTSGKN